jgi:hypothetical protein
MTIDEYVVQEARVGLEGGSALCATYRDLMAIVRTPQVCSIEYETMVLDFPAWVDSVLRASDVDPAERVNEFETPTL